jgi:hypothetical protein
MGLGTITGGTNAFWAWARIVITQSYAKVMRDIVKLPAQKRLVNQHGFIYPGNGRVFIIFDNDFAFPC